VNAVNAILAARRPRAQYEEAIRGGATGGAAAGIAGATALGGPVGLGVAAISTVAGGLIGQRFEEARLGVAEYRFNQRQIAAVERAQQETLAGFARQRERRGAVRGLEIETRRDIATEVQRLLTAVEQSFDRQLRTTIEMERTRRRELQALRSSRIAVGAAAAQEGPFQTERTISQVRRALRGEDVRFDPFTLSVIKASPRRDEILGTQITAKGRELTNLLGFGSAIRDAQEDVETAEQLIQRLQQVLAQERTRLTNVLVENQRLLRIQVEQALKDEIATGVRIQAQQVHIVAGEVS
jgi:hypothetical protein